MDPTLQEAMRTNLSSALHAALLQLPEKFTELELFLTVAAVSYTGDFRMVVGEDKNKVSNIVKPQISRFQQLYSRRLDACTEFLQVQDGKCIQDTSPQIRMHHLERLPQCVRQKLLNKSNGGQNVYQSISTAPDCGNIVRKAVGDLVAGTDKSQAAKGILTAGPYKATIYAAAKLSKMMKSLLK